MKNKNFKNKKRITELYGELDSCYSVQGCDHEKASNILNAIINRKKYLESSDIDSSSYVDCKYFIYHYVQSMKSKEHDYDEINVRQVLKIFAPFSSEQKLHLIDLFKRELNINGYSDQSEQLNSYFDEMRIEVYKKRKGLKGRVKWISLKLSYKKRYLIYWLIISFLTLSIVLISNNSFPVLIFQKQTILDNSFLNHIFNVVILIFDLDSDVYIKPINFAGVLLMVAGKIFFLLFIVNFLLRKIFDKILD